MKTRERLKVDGVDVGEVDLIAEDAEGTRYAVEVKAGKVTVGDLRNAYGTAHLLKMKPLIVCRDFADKAAELVAKELGIKVIRMARYFLVEPEEIRKVLEEIVCRTLEEELLGLLEALEMSPKDARILQELSESRSISELTSRLQLPERQCKELIGALRKRYRLLRKARNFEDLRRKAFLLSKIREILRFLREPCSM